MPHIYYGQITSLCETCLQPVPAKIVFEAGKVYYLKYCSTHKFQRVLISTDVAYYKRCAQRILASAPPLKFAGPIDRGCPLDCGLCEDHEQHTAMAIAEILDECNLECPTCIAASRPGAGNIRSLQQIETMFDALVEHEGQPDLLMISGGEPTIHPQIIDVLRLAKSKPIKHLMLISNGVKIAEDPEFVRQLKEFRDHFEVYLQFDSLNAGVLENIRGQDLRSVRSRAIENLEDAGIHMTLVCVVKNRLNEGEVGEVVEFALQYPHIRGVTFQPCKEIGRTRSFDRELNYITLAEVRRHIIDSGNYFRGADLIPHPLNPENISIGYLLKDGTETTPVTRYLFGIADKATSNWGRFEHAKALGTMMYFLPELDTPKVRYQDLFRVAIVSFLDQYNFNTTAARRSCIHFLTPQGKIIPIDTYYLLYHDPVRLEMLSRQPRADRAGAA